MRRLPLTPSLDGADPPRWRTAGHWECDWREHLIVVVGAWPWDRRLERSQLAVRRSENRAYVHVEDGSWRCVDLAADPMWRTEIDDPAIVLAEVQAMLDWLAHRLDRALTCMLLRDGVVGRLLPDLPFASGR